MKLTTTSLPPSASARSTSSGRYRISNNGLRSPLPVLLPSPKSHKTRSRRRKMHDKPGAAELDMVLNWPLLKQRRYVSAYSDVLEVRKSAPEPVQLKVILETPQLTRQEIVGASMVAIMAGADYIQSSTGIKEPRVTPELVSLMRATCDVLGRGTKVKASGDFRTAEDCIQVLRAGANRVESSTSMEILQELGGEELQEQGASHAKY